MYAFHQVETCNFCGADASHFKVIGRRLNRAQGRFPNKLMGVSTTICQCKKCELIFSNPQPVPNSILDHYDMDPSEFWVREDYFELSPDFYQQELNYLREVLDWQKGDKALDIGAGIGKAMIALQNAGFDVYGIEPGESFLNMAVERMNIPREKLQLGAIEDAEYPENTFSFITYGAVLEHLYDPNEALIKGLKWLKPGGIIHIEVPNSRWLTSRIGNFFYRLTNSGFAANISPMHSPFHLYEFSSKSFAINGERLGYEVAKQMHHVCSTYLPRVLDPMVVPYMKATNTGMQLSVWLRKK